MTGRPYSWSLPVLGAGLLMAVAALACGDLLQEPDTGIAPLVDVTVASGNDQTGPAGWALPQPIRARLVSQSGGSTERLWVEWTVVEGEGSVEPRNSFTDADGIAEAQWILGPGPGRQRVVARFAGEAEAFEATLCDVCPE